MSKQGEREARLPESSKMHHLEFIERHMDPRRFEEFLRSFGGCRLWIPMPYDYEDRNKRLRARWRELRAQGVRATDAKSVLARDFNLSRKRVEDLVYGAITHNLKSL